MLKPYWQSPDDRNALFCADALEWLAGLDADSVDLIFADPPYYRVKGEWWDRQWATAEGFLAWIGLLCEQWARVLRPNGSLYCCASSKMATRVECKIAERFNVLNRIRWAKPAYSTKAEMFDKDTMRAFFPASEEIVFAEQFGPNGRDCTHTIDDYLRGDAFSTLRRYFVEEKRRLGIGNAEINDILGSANSGSGMAGHYFRPLDFPIWELPTREQYGKLQSTGAFLRDYDDLLAHYQAIQAEYEDLRRPFFATPDAPYTDTWDFATVPAYPGKHPCQKPQALLNHVIGVSSRPNALVLDCFCGSGGTGVAAKALGRRFVGCDISEHWVRVASRNIDAGMMLNAPPDPERAVTTKREAGLQTCPSLFEELEHSQ